MTYTFNRFIHDKLIDQYLGETIRDSQGNLMIVSEIGVSDSMDGLEINFSDRNERGQTRLAPYTPPPWERRWFGVTGSDNAIPEIINLTWDHALKQWISVKPKHERDEEKRRKRAERDRLSNEAAAKLREGKT